jgi:hypothetical protein
MREAAREDSLTIRFSSQEMDLIEFLAEQEDRTKGAMIRRLINEAIAAREADRKTL